MSEDAISRYRETWKKAIENLQAKDDDKTSSCRGCAHMASGKPAWMLSRTSRENMINGANDGCYICPMLLQGVDKIMADNEEMRSDDFSLQIIQKGAKTRLVRLLGTNRAVSFYIKENSPLLSSCLPDWPVGYAISGDTSSKESFAWFMEQLKKCDSSHEICKASSNSPLPRRVLDLGEPHDQRVRLYLSQGETERYVSLSHCWGTQSLPRTLFANIKSYEIDIPWGDLPLTYQHAISFTRRTNIRYLWIDSLCIVQDSEEDWRQEASKMASIYQDAYLTLSATWSAEPNEGLFTTVPDNLKKTYQVGFSTPPDQPQDLYARIYLTHLESGYGNKAQERETLPVFTRGWVLQERLLSKRVLFFGREELYWECLNRTSCECSGVVTDDSGTPYSSAQSKLYHGFARWKSLTPEKLAGRWHELVEEYTGLQLSHEQDIFPAISGLAKEFNRVKQSAYYAGLWGNSLLMDLLWHSDISYNDEWPCRPKKYRAPSWSWASLKGLVKYVVLRALTDTCQVLNVHCSLAGPDPTGEVASGYITLRGLMVISKLRYRKTDSKLFLINLYDLELLTTPKRVGNCFPDYNHPLEENEGSNFMMTVYCFMIGRKIPGETVYYLMLKRISEDAGIGCQVYERIGLLELFSGFEVEGEEFDVKIV